MFLISPLSPPTTTSHVIHLSKALIITAHTTQITVRDAKTLATIKSRKIYDRIVEIRNKKKINQTAKTKEKTEKKNKIGAGAGAGAGGGGNVIVQVNDDHFDEEEMEENIEETTHAFICATEKAWIEMEYNEVEKKFRATHFISLVDPIAKVAERKRITANFYSKYVGQIYYIPTSKEHSNAKTAIIQPPQSVVYGVNMNRPPAGNAVVALVINDDIVLDIAQHTPTVLSVLVRDLHGKHKIKRYQYNQNDHRLMECGKEIGPLEDGRLINIRGGLMHLGHNKISHFPSLQQQPKYITVPVDTEFTAIAPVIEGQRYILGSSVGDIFNLDLVKSSLVCLGRSSIPSDMVFLPDGHLYIASHYSDSVLLQLSENNPYLHTIQHTINIAPITDFVIGREDEIVTCSGAGHTGTLRTLKEGIACKILAHSSTPTLGAIYALYSQIKQNKDILVLSYPDYTTAISLHQNQMTPYRIEGMSNGTSLGVWNCSNGGIVQITDDSIRLISRESPHLLLDEYTSDVEILHADSYHHRVLLSTGNKIGYFSTTNDLIKLKGERIFDNEVTCISLRPPKQLRSIALVGTWADYSVHVISLPSLTTLTSVRLSVDIVPRSVIFSLEKVFVGVGDGSVFQCDFDGDSLLEVKRTNLGNDQVRLSILPNRNKNRKRKRSSSVSSMNHSINSEDLVETENDDVDDEAVFACCSKPVVFYKAGGRIVHSSVALEDVSCMVNFASTNYPGVIAFVTPGQLNLGVNDPIQKLHISTLRLEETPKKIAYNSEGELYGVLTTRLDQQAHLVEQSCFHVFKQGSFELLGTLELQSGEQPLCLKVLKFQVEDQLSESFFVIGTAYELPLEDVPSKGRILVVQLRNKILFTVAELQVDGGLFAMTQIEGLMVATVNSKVHIIRMMKTSESSFELVSMTSWRGRYMSLNLAAEGDNIYVGDLTKSATVLRYDRKTVKLAEVANDLTAEWTTALAPLAPDMVFCAESYYNIYILRQCTNNDKKDQLEAITEWNLGQMVNCISPYTSKNSREDVSPQLLLATSSGSMHIVSKVSDKSFTILQHIENNLANYQQMMGELTHSDWRTRRSMRRDPPPIYIIDGELIEDLLALEPSQINDVLMGQFDGGVPLETFLAKAMSKAETEKWCEEAIRLVEVAARV